MTQQPDQLDDAVLSEADAPTKEELAQRAAGFRWPPRQGEGPVAAAPTLPPLARYSVAAVAEPAVGADSIDDQPGGGPRQTAAGPAPFWPAFERVWLDLVAPPLRERMVQVGWSPDDVAAYCHRCGSTIGPHVAAEDGCPECRGKRLPWQRLIRLGEYEPPLSLFVQEVKFTRWRRLGRDLGFLLGEAVAAELAAAGAECRLIVPVPMSFRRRMVRGIDHARVLAKGAARAVGAPVSQPLKRRHRPSQLQVAPSQRPQNVSGTIRLRWRQRLGALKAAGPREVVLVVDDVTTTGATLRAACGAVAKAFLGRPKAERPAIWVAVVAKTPSAESRRGDSQGRVSRDIGIAAAYT